MRTVILQPMYLPWIGYFGLIDLADVFVFYDDVQFVERSWQRRNKIKMPNSWIWLSVPVIKRFRQKINEVMINNNIEWRKEHWKSIKYAYTRSAFFDKYATQFEDVYQKEWRYLVDLNISLIKKIASMLGINTRFILSSQLDAEGVKSDRLISILKSIDADEYISGLAAKSYIDGNRFKEEGIRLYWYEFKHPAYQQLYRAFIPYLSIIDLLFNTGNEAIKYIREGIKDALVVDTA